MEDRSVISPIFENESHSTETDPLADQVPIIIHINYTVHESHYYSAHILINVHP